MGCIEALYNINTWMQSSQIYYGTICYNSQGFYGISYCLNNVIYSCYSLYVNDRNKCDINISDFEYWCPMLLKEGYKTCTCCQHQNNANDCINIIMACSLLNYDSFHCSDIIMSSIVIFVVKKA